MAAFDKRLRLLIKVSKCMKKRRNSKQSSLENARGKIYLAMRLTLLLTMFFSFTAIASVSSQSVTLKLENASLRETIKELKNQTGVYFVFNEEDYLLVTSMQKAW